MKKLNNLDHEAFYESHFLTRVDVSMKQLRSEWFEYLVTTLMGGSDLMLLQNIVKNDPKITLWIFYDPIY